MKSTELRIGNLVNLNIDIPEIKITEIVEVLSLEAESSAIRCWSESIPDVDAWDLECDISPIPLTEEWLSKRFSESSFVCTLYEVGKMNVYFQDSIAWVDINGNSIELIYVHTLQNLHFALNNEELKLQL